MEERWLGTLGPRVSSIGLGCMSLAGAYGPVSESAALDLLDRAVDLGITHFDTADIYGMGISEEILGRFLRDRRPRGLTIATKGGIRFRRATGERYLDNSPAYFEAAIDNSLRRLGVERIDLYYVHRRHQETPIEEVVHALANLKRAGKIGAIGLSEVSSETLRAAHRVDRIAAVQSEYSLWTRIPERDLLKTTAELGHRVDRIAAVQSEYSLWTRIPERDLLKTTAELGIGFVAFSPLGRGMLTAAPPRPEDLQPRDFRKRNPRFSADNYPRNLAAIAPFLKLAEEMQQNPATLALAWILTQGRHVVAIPGTRSPDNLEAAVRAASLRLSNEELSRIEACFPTDFPWGERYGEHQRLGLEIID